MQTNDNRKLARNLSLVLAACILASLAVLLALRFAPRGDGPLQADIYRDGELIASIRLDQVTVSYTLPIEASDGGRNLIEVRPNEIGILSADCPDKLCVRQGFRHDALYPIVCLPHRLVIRLSRETDADGTDAVVR